MAAGAEAEAVAAGAAAAEAEAVGAEAVGAAEAEASPPNWTFTVAPVDDTLTVLIETPLTGSITVSPRKR